MSEIAEVVALANRGMDAVRACANAEESRATWKRLFEELQRDVIEFAEDMGRGLDPEDPTLCKSEELIELVNDR